MTWYYALGNERQGPIDDAALDRLIATGAVTQDTLVWKAGMADWQPLGQARPRAAAPPPPAPVIPPPPAAITPAASVPDTQPRFGSPAPTGTPAGTFTPNPTPTPGAGAYGSAYGAGAGAGGWTAPGPAVSDDPDQLLARVASEGRPLAIGEIIGRAWQLVMDNLGLAVGASAIFLLANMAGAIPCVGILITLGVTPILQGGIYRLMLKLRRDEPAEFGDAFSTFSTSYLQLFLYTLVQFVLICVCLVPGYVLIFMGSLMAERSQGLSVLLSLVGFLIMVPPAIYLTVSWVFASPLIVDKGLNFWPAMELSRKVVAGRFFSVFGLVLLCGLIALAGVLALCVGVFFAVPVALATIALAYDDLFGRA
jgi:hypothetical protein